MLTRTRSNRNPNTLQAECKMVEPLWKLFGQLLTELNIVSTYDPATILRDIFPIDLKTYVNTKICT